MMKKYFYPVVAATTLLMAASCSQDDELVNGSNGNEETVSFTISTGEVATRAAGDGNSVNTVHYEVWDKNTGSLVISTIDGSDAKTKGRPEGVEGGRATVSMSLVKGVPYDITFWAEHKDSSAFDITAGLDEIKLKDGPMANMEKYDAFFKTLYDFKVKNGSTTVELKRPFAQVNVGTTPADWERAKALGVNVNQSTVTVSGVHNQFNARTAEASGEATVTYALKDIFNETFTAADSTYQYLAMNYMLADSEKTIHDMEVTFNDGKTVINTISVTNMPIQRNWRTNIVGRVLTSDEDFIIIIDPEFEGEHNRYIWGGEVEPVTAVDGVYTITEAGQLAWIAQQVNSGENTFSGSTVVLAADLDLNNLVWTPIGLNADSSNDFLGTFDGQGHTIYNLFIKPEPSYTSAGLFGTSMGTIKNLTIENATIEHIITSTNDNSSNGIAVVAGSTYNTKESVVENVTVKNATIKGNRYIGGIVGYADGTIKNCVVEGLDIVATPNEYKDSYSNGDKLGGIVGYTNSDIVEVSGNTATDVTIYGYRDMGGISGSAKAEVFTNNTATTVSLTVDQATNFYAAKDPNAAGVIGRVLTGTVADSNTATDVTINYIGVKMQPTYDATTKTWTITNAAELTWLAAAVNGDVAVTRAATGATGDSFAGETIVLANDIDLVNQKWSPICDSSEGCAQWFEGTFDGKNHTIKNLNVEVEGTRKPAGLFGKVLGTIKDLKVDGAKIVGFGQNGVISGHIYGNISGCTVTNAEVTANVEMINGNYDNGDKVGAIVGQVGEGNYSITGCTVSNTTLKAYRDAGAITGCLTTNDAEHTQTVSGNTVGENVVIIIDQSATPYADAPKAPNAKDYVGSLCGEGKFVVKDNTGEATIYCASANAENLINALENGQDVVLNGDIKIDPAGMSNAYGKTGINVKNGQTIDGNGYTLDIKGAGGTWDSGINTTGGLIKNITVTGSFRGIFINHNSEHSEQVVLENVTIDGTTYTISCDQGMNQTLKATNCTFNGWTSYAATLGSAEFIECNFGEGNGYAFMRPYAPTTFKGCTFEAGYEMDPRAAVTFENCTLGGVALTAENLATLVTSNVSNATVK